MNIRDVEERMSVIDPSAAVSTLAVVGAPGEWRDRDSKFPAFICDDVIVREFVVVHAGCERATIVGERTLLMAGCHVGHDVQIAPDCEVAPRAVIGGCASIGERVKIGMGAVIKPFVTIGDGARIGMGAVVTKDVPDGETWAGSPARKLDPKS